MTKASGTDSIKSSAVIPSFCSIIPCFFTTSLPSEVAPHTSPYAPGTNEPKHFVDAELRAGREGHCNREWAAGLYGRRQRRHTKRAVLRMFQAPVLTRHQARQGQFRGTADDFIDTEREK